MKSVQSINSITKAMQMISTFRFKRAETRFSKIRSYLVELESILANVSAAATKLEHPLFVKRPVSHKTLIVMTGDKGLCGSYNTNLLKAALVWNKENGAIGTSFIPVGKVGCEAFKKKGLLTPIFYTEKMLVDFHLAKKMTGQIKDLFVSGRTDEVSLLYTHFKPGGSGVSRIEPFFPLTHLAENKKDLRQSVEYIYEPGFENVFFDLIGRYIEGKIYLSALESLTSEYSARMMAMKQASENGEEVLEDLKLLRNKTRQAVITRELSEIVSGASVQV